MQSPRTPSKSTPTHGCKRKKRKYDRGFDEIPLLALGAQLGKDRYAAHPEQHHPLPQLATHRINLAVLSQRYNLYIVASGPFLLLFQPNSPDHEAQGETQCRFELPATNPHLSGYISVGDPHFVNNILVGDLGEEEILLCACDDGDVIVYWTRDLVRFFEDSHLRQQELHKKHRDRRKDEVEAGNSYWGPERRNEDPLESASRNARENEDRDAELKTHMALPPRQFFHENVGISAWGLAVHKEARLIAASANSRVITVWAPALTKSPEISKQDLEYDELLESHPIKTDNLGQIFSRDICSHQMTIPGDIGQMKLDSRVDTTRLSDRDCEWQRILCAHRHNIPCIAFCNTPTDPSGRYLASTDVTGATIVWDINRGIPVRIMKFPDHEYGPGHHLGGLDKMGWGLAFFDKRSFLPTESILEAMGTCSRVIGTVTTANALASDSNLRKRNLEVYDISSSHSIIRNTDRWAGNKISKQSTVPTSFESTDELNLAGGYDSSDEEVHSPEVDIVQSSNERPRPSVIPAYQNNLIGRIPQFESVTVPVTLQSIHGGELELQAHTARWPLFTLESFHAGHGHHSDLGCPFIPSQDEMPDSPIMLLNTHTIHLFQSPSLLNPPNGKPHNLTEAERQVFSWLPDPGRPFVPKEWRYPKIVNPDGGRDPGPTIYFDDPLAQEVPDELLEQMSNVHDRLCMISQIPELGVVLIGSPKGRVAVFTLHQLMPDRSKQIYSDEEPVYTMRLDHILPFSDQEKKHLRPLQPLSGLSSGPIFRPDGSIAPHRWRVMLLYKDQSLLTYEIWRPGHAPASCC